MKCRPNYILSDALKQALPFEKLIWQCPLYPVSITFLSECISLPSLVNVHRGNECIYSSVIPPCPKKKKQSLPKMPRLFVLMDMRT